MLKPLITWLATLVYLFDVSVNFIYFSAIKLCLILTKSSKSSKVISGIYSLAATLVKLATRFYNDTDYGLFHDTTFYN